MPRPDPTPTQLGRDLTDLKLLEIAKSYREVLDEAARKGSSMLEVLATLIGMEQTVRQQRPRTTHPASTTAQAQDLDRICLHLSQTHSEDSNRSPLRLRLHPTAWLWRPDRPDRNREDTSPHRLGLHSL